MRSILITLAAILAFGMPGTGHAQSREVPYWASLRAEVVNMRVGPSQDYRIEWVYRRQGLPVKVVRVVEGWRLVSDPDGEQGRSEEHTSELQSLMRISYAVFCLKKKTKKTNIDHNTPQLQPTISKAMINKAQKMN